MGETRQEIKVTKCPTAFCCRSTGENTEADRLALQQYEAQRHKDYVDSFSPKWVLLMKSQREQLKAPNV